MATLSSKAYRNLPNSQFAYVKKISEQEAKKWPAKRIKRTPNGIYLRRFPINDEIHQEKAVQLVGTAKRLPSSAKTSIKNTASKKLYGKKDEKKMQGMVTSYKKGYSS